ncbi:hypothetical protein Tco_1442031 [Tanacetum coccineum]
MGDENPIRTLGDYSKPTHEGYKNTIELFVGNNMVPFRSDTIWLVQNECSFHGLLSEDPNQHLKDFLKLVDSLDLDVTRRTIDQSTGGKLRDLNAEESWAVLDDLTLYDNESWNDPSGPHDTQYCMEDPEQAFVEYVSSRTNEAGGKWYTFKPEQNNLGDTYNPSWRSHPNLRWRQPQNSQNNFSNPPNQFQPNGSIPNHSFNNHPQNFNNQSNIEGLVSEFMESQDARLSKFEANFKRQQGEMTNKINTLLKAIIDQIAGTLPSDTVKNPKLGTHPVSSALLAHTPIYNAILDKYVESLELGKNGSTFVQAEVPIKMEDPETPLLVGRGFLATANAVIDCRMAKIAIGEGITRSVFSVKGVDLGEEEAPYWTTLGKR